MVVCLPYSKHAPASLTVEREKSPELGVLEEHSTFLVSAKMKCLQVILRSNISVNFTLKGPSQQWGLFLKRTESRDNKNKIVCATSARYYNHEVD